MVRFVLAATIAVALTSVLDVSRASAAEPQAPAMVVTCNEMCGGCVKKIEKRFAEDKGLVVTYDIPTKTVAFPPVPGTAGTGGPRPAEAGGGGSGRHARGSAAATRR